MADTAYEQLLASLVASGDVPGSVPTMEELLQQLGNTNPRMQLIANYLAQRQAEAKMDDNDLTLPDKDRLTNKTELRSSRRKRSMDHLRQMVENMYSELEALREINDTLAEALGACHLCWGGDSTCELCRGQGSPGFAAPDWELFTQFVSPAVHRLQKDRRVNDRLSNKTNSKPSVE